MSKEKKETSPAVKSKSELAVKERPSSIQEFNRLFDTLWDPFHGFVIDSGKEYVVKAELPGLKKENVEIEVGLNELSLTARSEVEKEEKGRTYVHRERGFSTFRRYIGFADRIETDKVSANMSDGVLEIRLPKQATKPEKERKKVAVK
jgi:HSP20 family protein